MLFRSERQARAQAVGLETLARVPAPDDHEWADPRAHASLHRADRGVCGVVHQRGQPCDAPWT